MQHVMIVPGSLAAVAAIAGPPGRVPAARTGGTDEVANAALRLLPPQASHITVVIFTASGGHGP